MRLLCNFHAQSLRKLHIPQPPKECKGHTINGGPQKNIVYQMVRKLLWCRTSLVAGSPASVSPGAEKGTGHLLPPPLGVEN